MTVLGGKRPKRREEEESVRAFARVTRAGRKGSWERKGMSREGWENGSEGKSRGSGESPGTGVLIESADQEKRNEEGTREERRKGGEEPGKNCQTEPMYSVRAIQRLVFHRVKPEIKLVGAKSLLTLY